jgi:hypothetical protein
MADDETKVIWTKWWHSLFMAIFCLGSAVFFFSGFSEKAPPDFGDPGWLRFWFHHVQYWIYFWILAPCGVLGSLWYFFITYRRLRGYDVGGE